MASKSDLDKDLNVGVAARTAKTGWTNTTCCLNKQTNLQLFAPGMGLIIETRGKPQQYMTRTL